MKKTNRFLVLLASAFFVLSGISCSGSSSSNSGSNGSGEDANHEHTFAETWTSDSTYHWHAATCGDTTAVCDKEEHTFGDWSTTKEPEEQTDGIKEKSCTVCGYKIQDSVPKLFSAHSVEVSLADLNLNSISSVTSSDESCAAAVKTDSGIKITSVHSGKNILITAVESSTRQATVELIIYQSGTIAKSVNGWSKTPLSGNIKITTVTGGYSVRDTLKISYTDGRAGETFTYHWYADGTEISGASTDEYVLTSNYAYKCISAEVRGTGDFTGSVISSTTNPIIKISIKGTAAISGTAKIGETLTGSYTGGAADETVTYTWYADRTKISGASGTAWTITSEEIGKKITFTVSGTGEFNGDSSASTAAVADYGYTASYAWTESVKSLDAGTDGTGGDDSTYVLFGDWPQTIAAAGVQFNLKAESNGYYIGSDGNYYARCLESAYNAGNKYSDGTTVKESSAVSYKYFKVEPVKWRVVSDSFTYNGTDKAKLLVAEKILLANIPYCGRSKTNNTDPNRYNASYLSSYLNGRIVIGETSYLSIYKNKGFLQKAWTTAAQDLIKTTTVDNSADSTTDADEFIQKATSYCCADSTAKIFSLSEKEITTTAYFALHCNRLRLATDYALANNAFVESGYYYDKSYGAWWLRSPAYDDRNYAYYVNPAGLANSKSEVQEKSIGIVPAIVVAF